MPGGRWSGNWAEARVSRLAGRPSCRLAPTAGARKLRAWVVAEPGERGGARFAPEEGWREVVRHQRDAEVLLGDARTEAGPGRESGGFGGVVPRDECVAGRDIRQHHPIGDDVKAAGWVPELGV